MRFTVVLAFCLSLLSPALAFDGAKSVQDYYSLRQECRIGETTSGQSLSAEQAEASCAKLDKLGQELKTNGYCWDASEQEWSLCKQ